VNEGELAALAANNNSVRRNEYRFSLHSLNMGWKPESVKRVIGMVALTE
jgi:hypothetical protein